MAPPMVETVELYLDAEAKFFYCGQLRPRWYQRQRDSRTMTDRLHKFAG